MFILFHALFLFAYGSFFACECYFVPLSNSNIVQSCWNWYSSRILIVCSTCLYFQVSWFPPAPSVEKGRLWASKLADQGHPSWLESPIDLRGWSLPRSAWWTMTDSTMWHGVTRSRSRWAMEGDLPLEGWVQCIIDHKVTNYTVHVNVPFLVTVFRVANLQRFRHG